MEKYVILVKCDDGKSYHVTNKRGYYSSINAAKKGLSEFKKIAGYFRNFEKEIPVPYNGTPEIKKIA
jgi:hypothetical protein